MRLPLDYLHGNLYQRAEERPGGVELLPLFMGVSPEPGHGLVAMTLLLQPRKVRFLSNYVFIEEVTK